MLRHNCFPVDGFCDTNSTEEIDRGVFQWQESVTNSSDTHSCPFGPSGAVGTRMCVSRLIWSDPVVDMCGTVISLGFQTLNETSDQVKWDRITIGGIIERNLTDSVVLSRFPRIM